METPILEETPSVSTPALKTDNPKTIGKLTRSCMEEQSSEPSTSSKLIRRRTRRISKKNSINDVDKSKLLDLKTKWTPSEMKTVINALDAHGLTRIETISKRLPYKTPEQVKAWLWKMGRNSYLVKKKEKVKDEMLLKEECAVGVALGLAERGRKPGLNTRQLSCISKTLLLISALEDQPPVNGPHDIDFKQLYNALYMAMKGYPLPKMNSATLNFFMNSFDYVLRVATVNPINPSPFENFKILEGMASSEVLNPLAMDIDFFKANLPFELCKYDIKMQDWLSAYDWSLL